MAGSQNISQINGYNIYATASAQAESASYALTALNLLGSIQSASYAGTASILLGSIQSASYSATASYVLGGGSTNPGGSNTQIQYNNSNAFGGVPVLTYDGTTLRGTGSFSGSFRGNIIGSASISTTASYSLTASYVDTALTASFIKGTIATSSYAGTASYSLTLGATLSNGPSGQLGLVSSNGTSISTITILLINTEY